MRGGQFSLTIARLAMDLVLETGASMRGAAAGLRLTAARLDLGVTTPSFGAVRSWLLRLGCYATGKTCCPVAEVVRLRGRGTTEVSRLRLRVNSHSPVALRVDVPAAQR